MENKTETQVPYRKIGLYVTLIGLFVTCVLMGWNIFEARNHKAELTISSHFTGGATFLTFLGIVYFLIGGSISERFAENENAKIKIYEYIVLIIFCVGAYFAHERYNKYLESLGYKDQTIFDKSWEE